VIPLRDVNPTRRTPVVTIALIVACLAVFAYELGLESGPGDSALTHFMTRYGVVPARVTAALDHGELLSPAALPLVTSQFIHGGWLHLLGNMLYLWIFGNNVEDRMGRLPFLLLYLGGGVVAALTQVAVDPTSRIPLVGASGAISAALGAYLVFFPSARVLTAVFLGFFYQLVELPAFVLLGFWFVLQLVDGILSLGASSAVGGGVAFFAHVGGFLMGMAVALLWRPLVPRGPWDRQW
jgi:membrane associated rhomboid family serine protease